MAENSILPGTFYRHFKGNIYKVLGIALHTETGEELVIYQAQYGEYRLFARPIEMFSARLDKTQYPDASQTYRFEQIEDFSSHSAPHLSGETE